MKRQTKIKNKSIKVKRRFGGSMYTPRKSSNDQDWRRIIGYNNNNSKKSRISHTNKQSPLLSPLSSHTT